ncbi:hypothetical protein [Treponema pectinovorum]|uniref:hypothetical protein n=1 Tax=Treponema pectinovorum TaxID=164 RepID=UPI0011CB08D4|nr:hypothetical protein [Treponema pectinovorum]
MTYKRKIYSFCIGAFCALFMLGCSAIEETSSVGFNLDLTSLSLENSNARQVFDSEGQNIKLRVLARVMKADFEHSSHQEEEHNNQMLEIFYPQTKNVNLTFRDLEVGESYRIFVNIWTVEEGQDFQISFVANGEATFEVKPGDNQVRLTLTKDTGIMVMLGADISKIELPQSTEYHRYILFKLTNTLDNKTWYGFEDAKNVEEGKVWHGFAGYDALLRTKAQVSYIITKDEIKWAGKDSAGKYQNRTSIDGLKYSVLAASDEKTYFVAPTSSNGSEKLANFTIKLDTLQSQSQGVEVGVLATPKILYEAKNCTVVEPPSSSTIYGLTLSQSPTSPTIKLTAKTKDNNSYESGVVYEWFLNGSKMQETDGVSSDGSFTLKPTENSKINSEGTNTVMVIVSKDGQMQSAIWQFAN